MPQAVHRGPVTPRDLLRPPDVLRMLLGWAAFGVVLLARPLLQPPVAAPLLIAALAAIVTVIIVCAFAVVKQAEGLAHRLGDPYGTLVLTLSIVGIEVVLIAAVMLGPGEHTTIARDSVMAVSMIILNLIIGLSLMVGGLTRRGMTHNRTGTSTYLAMLIVLSSLTFALPAVIGNAGSFEPMQAIPIIVLTLLIYPFFLYRQMGVQAPDFQEIEVRDQPPARPEPGGGRVEVLTRLVILVVTVIPIVLLSHDMAALLDDGLGRAGAPTALAGVLIAMIVFLPESLTSIRAAHAGEIQRVSNLCHGALVSTVGLTVPVVLIIGLATGQQVVLAETPANLLLLGVTLLLSVATFSSPRVTAIHGAVHLAVFAVYGVILFS